MAHFRDSKNRLWRVRITPWEMNSVKEFTGVNLGTVLRDNMRQLVEILEDPALMCTILFAICEEQCKEQKVDTRDFVESIVGDPIEDAAAAFLEGLQDVFPQRQAVALMAANRLMRKTQKESDKKLKQLLKTMTSTNSHSRWRAFLAWIRGSIPAGS